MEWTQCEAKWCLGGKDGGGGYLESVSVLLEEGEDEHQKKEWKEGRKEGRKKER